ncbi:MAG: type IVB secretion system protein IcmH/DotU [Spongiibacteraceae bacterium]|jgi:type VI secretion system protein ImpK
MSDDSDKTIFMAPNTPSATGDRTVVIPNPGARPPSPLMQKQDTAISAAITPASFEHFEIQDGLNPIVTAASNILTVSNRLRTTLEHNDPQGLQRQLINEIKQFEQAAKNQQVPAEQLLPARYLLCALLDEIALNAPWGASSRWSQHSLLSQFHNETSGGEKFFSVLQRMLEAPAQHLDVLELFYLCLSLGFQGKFRLDPRGRENLEHISSSLYQTIKNYRGEFQPDLSPNWSSHVACQRSMMQYIPLWVVSSCVLVALMFIFSGFRLWLYQSTEPTTERLNQLLQTAQTQHANDATTPMHRQQ